MSKRVRQYIGLIMAILIYYVIHEGSHLIYALFLGVFKQINLMGLGVQIDVYTEKMSEVQLGIFCIVGSVVTLVIGYVLVILTNNIVRIESKMFKACMYYITVALLLIDPLYLSVLCGFFGGGDMNGIAILIPELLVRIIYAGIFAINIFIFFKGVLPKYRKAFKK